METKYPIFVTAKDDPMVEIIQEAKELRKYDDIDIEQDLFFGWDSDGVPLEFYIDRKEVKVRTASAERRLYELRNAILNYVKLAAPKVSFAYSGPEDNMVELFKAVEEHIKKESSMNKGFLSKCLKKLFG